MYFRRLPGSTPFYLAFLFVLSAGCDQGSTQHSSNTHGGDTGGGSPFVPMRPSGTAGYDCSDASGSLPPMRLTKVAGDLDEPVQVVHPPNFERLFIVQRGGKILLLSDGEVRPTPFLDISDRVVSNDDDTGEDNGDRALGGMAFHPDYSQNGLFYVYYNTQPRNGAALGDAILAQYSVSSDADVADRDSEKVLLHIPRNGHIDHHGGGLAFGGDGMLYLALGDGNSWQDGKQVADPDKNGQDPSTLLGSILRIQPQPDGSYTSPSGNLRQIIPEAAPEVWDYGLRNPFRIAFDGCTGTLYIADVGFEKFEEIDIELPGQGHKNYGWPVMEGPKCEKSGCDSSGMTPPAYSYAWEAASKTTVIGGAVYRGHALPALRGKFVFADFLRNAVYYLSFDENTRTVSEVTDISAELDYPSGPTSVGNGADGEIYITSYSDNAVYRIDPE